MNTLRLGARALTGAFLVTAFGWAGAARADVNDGLRAYQKGDYAVAYEEFAAAAASDIPEGQYNLGLLYFFGLGTVQNYASAFESFQRAAAADYAAAQFMIGAIHERGEGVAVDVSVAQLWYELAAQNGHVDAQYRAGMLGAQSDPRVSRLRGLVWVMLAAARGHPEAQANIATLSRGLSSAEVAAASQIAAVLEGRQRAAAAP
jgi:TPR repeat protein